MHQKGQRKSRISWYYQFRHNESQLTHLINILFAKQNLWVLVCFIFTAWCITVILLFSIFISKKEWNSSYHNPACHDDHLGKKQPIAKKLGYSTSMYLEEGWKQASHIAFVVRSSNQTLRRWRSHRIVNALFARDSSSAWETGGIIKKTNTYMFSNMLNLMGVINALARCCKPVRI